ncbi:prepilin-type N-terminal cleavage/methylation domain-containing protein [Candidatus Margulisiibacteriota bacterium]
MNRQKVSGFSLLELIIAIALLIIIIPSIYSSFLFMHKKVQQADQSMLKETEFSFIKNVFYDDFKDFLKEPVTGTAHLFTFITGKNETIHFDLRDKRIRREKIKPGKTKGSVSFLNSLLLFTDLDFQRISTKNINISLALSDSEQRNILIYLINAK